MKRKTISLRKERKNLPNGNSLLLLSSLGFYKKNIFFFLMSDHLDFNYELILSKRYCQDMSNYLFLYDRDYILVLWLMNFENISRNRKSKNRF